MWYTPEEYNTGVYFHAAYLVLSRVNYQAPQRVRHRLQK